MDTKWLVDILRFGWRDVLVIASMRNSNRYEVVRKQTMYTAKVNILKSQNRTDSKDLRV